MQGYRVLNETLMPFLKRKSHCLGKLCLKYYLLGLTEISKIHISFAKQVFSPIHVSFQARFKNKLTKNLHLRISVNLTLIY